MPQTQMIPMPPAPRMIPSHYRRRALSAPSHRRQNQSSTSTTQTCTRPLRPDTADYLEPVRPRREISAVVLTTWMRRKSSLFLGSLVTSSITCRECGIPQFRRRRPLMVMMIRRRRLAVTMTMDSTISVMIDRQLALLLVNPRWVEDLWEIKLTKDLSVLWIKK